VIEAEQDPARADPRTYSRIGLETMRQLLGTRVRPSGAGR